MKLHIGCGPRYFGEDWCHIDGADYSHIKDKDVLLISWQSNSADIIYASHFIEYYNRTEVVDLLKEWHRVLKPAGELMIAVPDFDAIVKLFHDKEYEIEQFLGLLYGEMKMKEQKIYHRTIYNHKSLSRLLAGVGFKEINRVNRIAPYEQDDHSCAVLPHMNFETGTPMSLNVIATK